MWSSGYTIEELKSRNNIDFDGPIIAYCPDWRRTRTRNGKESYMYMHYFIDNFEHIFEEKLGAKLHYMSFDEKLSDIKDKIDGCFISGGRDIDPKLYGEPNKGSKVDDPELAQKRWDWCKDLFENAEKKMPIFGVCYGFEVLNCIFGGKMIQEIENRHAHYDLREMKVEEGSHLFKAIGNRTSMVGQCYHHQGITNVPEKLWVTATDDHCGMPHALEWKGEDREIFSVLWHPESTGRYMGGTEKRNMMLLKYFVERCKKFRVKRLGRN